MSTQQVVTIELAWLDGEGAASAWACAPSGARLSWEGFISLDAASLRSPAVRAVSTVVGEDLRRALFSFGLTPAGGDGAAADAPTVDQGAR